MRLEAADALAIAKQAVLAAGGHEDMAGSLARATVSAEWAGNRAVGFAHLVDYVESLRAGRIAGDARPDVFFPAPGAVRIDANRGIAQLGFDQVFKELVAMARSQGVAILTQFNSFSVGELGYYTRRLAEEGLVALAACNANALMTTVESGRPVFGTNPLSFAVPTARGKPFVIDQASSATAFVNVRRAAAAGERISEGWAVDAAGRPTTDAKAAAQGLLLPFGGARGAHIAMMVEILCAGLTGGNWSIDAPHFARGSESPAVGLFVLAIHPDAGAASFASRLTDQVDRLAGAGVRIPGSHIDITGLDIDDEVLRALGVASAGQR